MTWYNICNTMTRTVFCLRSPTERFCQGLGGYVVSIIGQDSYFKTGSEGTKWDAPEALDHQKVLEVLEEEIHQPMVAWQGF